MLEKLQELYSELTGDYNTVLKPKTKLDGGLNLSSLGRVQLICKIEDVFDIEIPAAEIRKLKTVKDLISYIEKNV